MVPLFHNTTQQTVNGVHHSISSGDIIRWRHNCQIIDSDGFIAIRFRECQSFSWQQDCNKIGSVVKETGVNDVHSHMLLHKSN